MGNSDRNGLYSFIAFILFFVIRMASDARSNHHLVTKDYYKKELAYQEEINAQQKALDHKALILRSTTQEGILLTFPEGFDNNKITGTVSLYRPSNEHLDFDFPISLSNAHLLIPDERLLDGRWDISVSWNYEGNQYLFKDKISY